MGLLVLFENLHELRKPHFLTVVELAEEEGESGVGALWRVLWTAFGEEPLHAYPKGRRHPHSRIHGWVAVFPIVNGGLFYACNLGQPALSRLLSREALTEGLHSPFVYRSELLRHA